jgi:hypothetical protein
MITIIISFTIGSIAGFMIAALMRANDENMPTE